MKVRINGEIVDREIAYYDEQAHQTVPVLYPGEQVLWMLGSSVPVIIKDSK